MSSELELMCRPVAHLAVCVELSIAATANAPPTVPGKGFGSIDLHNQVASYSMHACNNHQSHHCTTMFLHLMALMIIAWIDVANNTIKQNAAAEPAGSLDRDRTSLELDVDRQHEPPIHCSANFLLTRAFKEEAAV